MSVFGFERKSAGLTGSVAKCKAAHSEYELAQWEDWHTSPVERQ